jgi:hypothetical protein
MNDKKLFGLAWLVARLLCVAVLLASCVAMRDRSVVKKEAAQAAAALGLTPADMLLAVDSTIDLGRYIYSEYYITTTIPISGITAVLKPLGYSKPLGAGGGGFDTLERLSKSQLKTVGTNPKLSDQYEAGLRWRKVRGQGSWTAVEAHFLESQQALYEYDGKPLSGTLIILWATYQ